MKDIGKQMILLALLVAVGMTVCVPQSKLENVQSATVVASINPTSSFILSSGTDLNTYWYNLKNKYSSTPQIAIALSGFNAQSEGSLSVFGSTARTNPTNLSIVINTPRQNIQWSSVCFQVLVNSRIDIEVGSHTFGKQCNTGSVAIPIKRAINDYSGYVAKAFISGFALTGQNSLSLVSGNVKNAYFNVTVKAGSKLTSLVISYFLFNPKNTSFLSYGGSLERSSFSGSESQLVVRSIASHENSLYGLTAFDFAGSSLTIDASINSGFLLTLSSVDQVRAFTFNYIIFGMSAKNACSHCNSTICNSNIECTNKCSRNQATYPLPDGSKACITCPASANLAVSSDGSKCVCSSNSNLVNGICVRSDEESPSRTPDYDTQPVVATVAAPTMTSSNDDVQQEAPQSCSDPNSYWTGYECACSPKYYPINGVCTECANGYFWNGINCIDLFATNHGPVPHKNHPNTPKPILCTGANQFTLADGTCACVIGFYMNNGSCSAGIECPPNSNRVSATVCACQTGFYNNSGFCTLCQPWFRWDNPSNCCVAACPANSAYDTNSQSCVCLTGFYKASSTLCSPCPSGSFSKNQICLTCPINSVINATGNGCTCSSGFTLVNFLCQPVTCTLGTNTYLNNGICQPCAAPNVGNGVQCVSCPSGSVFNNGACICPSNSLWNPLTLTCTACSGNGKFIYQGQCVSCPLNNVWNSATNQCQCLPGWTNTNGICVNTCPNGIVQNGLCLTCPINSYITGNVCSCLNGYARINGICTQVCQYPLFLVGGTCVSCPSNSVFNNMTGTCQCSYGFVQQSQFGICQKQCPVGSSLTSSNTCQALPGFYSAGPYFLSCPISCTTCTNGTTCTSCVNGFTLNGGACGAPPNVCLPNQYSVNNVCTNCASYCKSCSNGNSCNRCANGFNWNISSTACNQVCGDGRKFVLPCDDGNNVNGDGCSSSCQVQSGYICIGGSPTTRDVCTIAQQSQSCSYTATYSPTLSTANLDSYVITPNLNAGIIPGIPCVISNSRLQCRQGQKFKQNLSVSISNKSCSLTVQNAPQSHNQNSTKARPT